jgi:hypothetical protein
MSMNIGEEIVMAYLQYIKKCGFVQANVYTPDIQGEIDVVSIDIYDKKIYVCEVAVHLTTGLMYVHQNLPNNVNKLVEKLSKDIDYADKYFPGYEKIVMLWSPIVKNQKAGSKYNQLNDVMEIEKRIKEKYNVELLTIINEKYMSCLGELRKYTRADKTDNKSSVIRLMQIEEYLAKHISNLTFSPKESTYSLYAEKFGVEEISNWSGMIGLRQKYEDGYRYIYTRVQWHEVIAMMQLGLSLGTDLLVDTLLKTGHVWEHTVRGAK